MNRSKLVFGTVLCALLIFLVGWWFTTSKSTPAPVVNTTSQSTTSKDATSLDSSLIRPYSPVLGPENAPVTIVEFFDPACEACRAFHPVLVEIRKQYPKEVRIVMRYAAFHDGSDIAVKILETARLQNMFEPILEALLKSQPSWADHSGSRLDIAWAAAKDAGLDIEKAREQMKSPEINFVLTQDAADIKTNGVRQTPTFYVNGKPLLEFGAQQLMDMVSKEVEATR